MSLASSISEDNFIAFSLGIFKSNPIKSKFIRQEVTEYSIHDTEYSWTLTLILDNLGHLRLALTEASVPFMELH